MSLGTDTTRCGNKGTGLSPSPLRAPVLLVPAVLACAVFALTLGVAEASTVLRFSPDDMTDRAAIILHGKVVAKRARHLAKGVIVTDYRLEVFEAYKGFKGKQFAFSAYGGVLGKRGSGISGAASYHMNEEILIFLAPINKLGCRAAVGLAQGKYTIRTVEGRKLAFRDLEGLRLMDRQSGKIEEGHDHQQEQGVAFAELVERVKQRVAANKKKAAQEDSTGSEGSQGRGK